MRVDLGVDSVGFLVVLVVLGVGEETAVGTLELVEIFVFVDVTPAALGGGQRLLLGVLALKLGERGPRARALAESGLRDGRDWGDSRVRRCDRGSADEGLGFVGGCRPGG